MQLFLDNGSNQQAVNRHTAKKAAILVSNLIDMSQGNMYTRLCAIVHYFTCYNCVQVVAEEYAEAATTMIKLLCAELRGGKAPAIAEKQTGHTAATAWEALQTTIAAAHIGQECADVTDDMLRALMAQHPNVDFGAEPREKEDDE